MARARQPRVPAGAAQRAAAGAAGSSTDTSARGPAAISAGSSAAKPAASAGDIRVAIDTGGTFTDCVYVLNGRWQLLKLFSTPAEPARAVAQALEAIAEKIAESDAGAIRHGRAAGALVKARVGEVLHGTTVATNALLERRLARTAFVTTAGFEDIIAIGRQNRPRLYDLLYVAPPPLVAPELRFGVAERVGPAGEILKPLRADDIETLRHGLRAAGAEAVAVSLLFAFLRPEHEREVAAALGNEFMLCCSSDILPQFREYERSVTTVVNAALQPLMAGYLNELANVVGRGGASRGDHDGAATADAGSPRTGSAGIANARIGRRLEGSVAGAKGTNDKFAAVTGHPLLEVMQSNGGMISAGSAAAEPVRTILSGPAGGIVGARAVAELAGIERVITFDMGGTSTDVALLRGPLETITEGEVAGIPVSVPMLDIHTVGSGGGSMARFDAGGALRVGPESAGADPGPIAYGRGGTRPTITDAHIVLGRLPTEYFPAGELPLNREQVEAALESWLAAQPHTERRRGETARGSEPRETRAVRGLKTAGNRGGISSSIPSSVLSSAHRGIHSNALDLADGIVRVANAVMEKALRVISIERGLDAREFTLIPFGGAGGLHACDLAQSLRMSTILLPIFPGALSAVGILLSDKVREYAVTVLGSAGGAGGLERAFRELEARAQRAFAAEGFEPGRLRLRRSLDVRYAGQGFELQVPWSAHFVRDFHRLHEQRYGYRDETHATEVVNVRLRAEGARTRPRFPRATPRAHAAAISGNRAVWHEGRKVKAALIHRSGLSAGAQLHGPAIVNEYGATTWVAPGWGGRVDAFGNLVLRKAGSHGPRLGGGPRDAN